MLQRVWIKQSPLSRSSPNQERKERPRRAAGARGLRLEVSRKVKAKGRGQEKVCGVTGGFLRVSFSQTSEHFQYRCQVQYFRHLSASDPKRSSIGSLLARHPSLPQI